jgi:hypothetical protein
MRARSLASPEERLRSGDANEDTARQNPNRRKRSSSAEARPDRAGLNARMELVPFPKLRGLGVKKLNGMSELMTFPKSI